MAARQVSETATRGPARPVAPRDHPGDERVRIAPSSQVTIVDRRPEARPRRRRLEPRDDERRAAGRGPRRASSAARAASPGSRPGSACRPDADEERRRTRARQSRRRLVAGAPVALGRDGRPDGSVVTRRSPSLPPAPATRRAGAGRPRTAGDREDPVGAPARAPAAQGHVVVLADREDRRAGGRARSMATNAVVGARRQVDDDAVDASSAAVEPGAVGRASASAPAPRTRSARRVAQIRSSARTATRAVSRASPRGGGRRRGR